MKSRLVIFIGFVTILSTLNIAAVAKDYSDKQFTLFGYQLDISKDFRKEIKLINSYIKDIEVTDIKAKDKLKAVVIHHIYYTIKDKLEEKIEIEILPVNSFLSIAKYDEWNYPNLTHSQAVRNGDGKYFFKVSVNIETVTEEQQKLNPDLFENINQDATMPKVTVSVDVFDKNGVIAIDHWEGSAIATKPILIDKKLLGSFDPKQRKSAEADDLASLSSITNRAIENMVESVYKRKRQ